MAQASLLDWVLSPLLSFIIAGCASVLYATSGRQRDLTHQEKSSRLLDSYVGLWSSSVSEESESTSSTPSSDEAGQSWVCAPHVLCEAIVKRDLHTVSRIIAAAPSLCQLRHPDGWYPIHAAVICGDEKILALVLAQPGISLSAADDFVHASATSESRLRRAQALGSFSVDASGATPLHYACMIGDTKVAALLLDHGASPDALDSIGRKPVAFFDLRRNLDSLVEYEKLCAARKARESFYSKIVDIDHAIQFIWSKNLDDFKTCLQENPQYTSQRSKFSFTLLHMAVMHELPDFVDHILSTDKSMIDNRDDRDDYCYDEAHNYFASSALPHHHMKRGTALHYACFTGNMLIAQKLLEAGADWNVCDWKERYPEDVIYSKGENGKQLKAEYLRMREEEVDRRRRKQLEEGEERKRLEEESGLQAESQPEEDIPGEVEPNSSDEQDSSIPAGEAEQEETTSSPPRPLEEVLSDKLIGQRGPIRSVANAVKLRANGWVDPDRPLVMLFLGSSGVGKTELAKQLALYIHGKDGLGTSKGQAIRDLEQEYGFIRVDMSEYQQSHTVSNLYGSPKGYLGYGEGGYLTSRLKDNPKAIVLIDEVEKAHPDVLTLFLQVFDDGRLTDTSHGVIQCKDAIFILTSNVASDKIKESAPFLRKSIEEAEAQNRPEEYLRIVRDFNKECYPILREQFKRDEFLGRINQIVTFLPLSDEEIGKVIDVELNLWRKRALEQHGIKVTWTEEVVAKLARAYDINYGARSVANQVHHVAIQLLAQAQVQGLISENGYARLVLNEVSDIVLDVNEYNIPPFTGCTYYI